MHALQMAVRLVADSADEIIVATPAWPNFRGVLSVANTTMVEVPMHLTANSGATGGLISGLWLLLSRPKRGPL
jgi:aspartate/methionine/tyrosine aminotransferase